MPEENRMYEYALQEKKADRTEVLIAIFDQNPGRRNMLKEWLLHITMNRNADLERIWFSDADAADKLRKYAVGFHIALISLDDEHAAAIGERLYEFNPDCLICYYKQELCDVRPVLHSRPYELFLWQQGEKEFAKMLKDMIAKAVRSANMFCYETKQVLYCYPYRNILYFQSNLKYVHVKTMTGNDAELYTKLSEVEHSLHKGMFASNFLRIHKSIIVNRVYIEAINKRSHTVRLVTGVELPVSDLHYQNVIKTWRRS